MDNLVLIRVAGVYARALAGGVVRSLRAEADDCYRLNLAVADRPRAVALSVQPTSAWTGRPPGHAARRGRWRGHFENIASRALDGAVLERVVKPAPERRLSFRFANGHRLEAELVPHRANLLLLDPEGVILDAARPVQSSGGRLQVGGQYRPPEPPAGRTDPFETTVDGGELVLRPDTLLQGLWGLSPTAAELLVRESREGGIELGALTRERLRRLLAGDLEPVIESREPPSVAAEEGRWEAAACRLLPWPPPWPPADGIERTTGEDAALTAGLFHAARDRALADRRRHERLRAVLLDELRHLRGVQASVQADLRGFANAERDQRWGEALLAGLSRARREGDAMLVPDPYDAEGRCIAVPVPPGQALTRAAESCFARSRRARRGLEQARARAARLDQRRARLEALERRLGAAVVPGTADALERALREEGIVVAGGHGGRSSGPFPAGREVRLAGVRTFVSAERDLVLIGRSGRDNQRLTFKIASAEDFWFHALGASGAHVVVRNDRRLKTPSRGTLIEAAQAAAWFSEARSESWVDVQWTQCRAVRRMRGAAPGTVMVKRFGTVRVRPGLPSALDDRS